VYTKRNSYEGQERAWSDQNRSGVVTQSQIRDSRADCSFWQGREGFRTAHRGVLEQGRTWYSEKHFDGSYLNMTFHSQMLCIPDLH